MMLSWGWVFIPKSLCFRLSLWFLFSVLTFHSRFSCQISVMMGIWREGGGVYFDMKWLDGLLSYTRCNTTTTEAGDRSCVIVFTSHFETLTYTVLATRCLLALCKMYRSALKWTSLQISLQKLLYLKCEDQVSHTSPIRRVRTTVDPSNPRLRAQTCLLNTAEHVLRSVNCESVKLGTISNFLWSLLCLRHLITHNK